MGWRSAEEGANRVASCLAQSHNAHQGEKRSVDECEPVFRGRERPVGGHGHERVASADLRVDSGRAVGLGRRRGLRRRLGRRRQHDLAGGLGLGEVGREACRVWRAAGAPSLDVDRGAARRADHAALDHRRDGRRVDGDDDAPGPGARVAGADGRVEQRRGRVRRCGAKPRLNRGAGGGTRCAPARGGGRHQHGHNGLGARGIRLRRAGRAPRRRRRQGLQGNSAARADGEDLRLRGTGSVRLRDARCHANRDLHSPGELGRRERGSAHGAGGGRLDRNRHVDADPAGGGAHRRRGGADAARVQRRGSLAAPAAHVHDGAEGHVGLPGLGGDPDERPDRRRGCADDARAVAGLRREHELEAGADEVAALGHVDTRELGHAAPDGDGRDDARGPRAGRCGGGAKAGNLAEPVCRVHCQVHDRAGVGRHRSAEVVHQHHARQRREGGALDQHWRHAVDAHAGHGAGAARDVVLARRQVEGLRLRPRPGAEARRGVLQCDDEGPARVRRHRADHKGVHRRLARSSRRARDALTGVL
mmetsp:Transcript_18714/g.71189  ORF Transcript_18714/g.71189 Transcript_18714/m.71189 type:complete len:533 (-) Transcript_18714:1366-2964(-)